MLFCIIIRYIICEINFKSCSPGSIPSHIIWQQCKLNRGSYPEMILQINSMIIMRKSFCFP